MGHGATYDTPQHIKQQAGYKATRGDTHPPGARKGARRLPARDHCGGSAPRRGGEMVNFGVHHLPLPGGAPAPKNRGSLPPLPPPPVSRHDAPCEAGDRRGGALRRFAAQDAGNPCQPVSNADFQSMTRPQRRGLRPLIVQFCGCQTRAPPACATPRLKGGHPYDATSLIPGGGNRRSFRDP